MIHKHYRDKRDKYNKYDKTSCKMRGWRRLHLALFFGLLTFLILLSTTLLMFLGIHILRRLGFTSNMPLLSFAIISMLIGTVISLLFSEIPISAFREIIEATDRLASGDFNARINLRGPADFHELNKSFNHMAKELGSLELLRNDFVNNFSHELKTPIVSIRGFALMLKNEDLSDEERTHYLDIIISESERLSELSTNVLNLSKLEHQNILGKQERFNLSEQIRRVTAVLLAKWSDKSIVIDFDSGQDEIHYTGDEELLSQLWINLLDNAMKFSPSKSTIDIRLRNTDSETIVTIHDRGIGISDDARLRIFDKFYQADGARTESGYGLGLAIAKRIVDLHGGEIGLVASSGTTLEVKLPI